ncbi:MAG: hypothetical protein SV862_10560 [Pseudomonadota bacterium]|nr:hypothetical protein [Pseudomonadota bacterium]
MAEALESLSWTCRNKKGRGETAPTFLIIAFTSASTSVVRVQAMRALRAAINSAPSLMPSHGFIGRTCQDNDGSIQAAHRWQWQAAGDG